MSRIAQLTNNDDPYGDIADDYLYRWKELAIDHSTDPPHATLSYGDNTSHGIAIPLFRRNSYPETRKHH